MIFISSHPGRTKSREYVKEMIYANFIKTGRSGRHSTLGHTLAPLLNRLTREGVPFTLYFDDGYYVKRGTDGVVD